MSNREILKDQVAQEYKRVYGRLPNPAMVNRFTTLELAHIYMSLKISKVEVE